MEVLGADDDDDDDIRVSTIDQSRFGKVDTPVPISRMKIGERKRKT